MLYTATTLFQPSAIRYPRGTGAGVAVAAEMTALPVGRAHVRREGRSGLAILVFGTLIESARTVAERLTRRWSTCASSNRSTRNS